jgi:hypothetical protein
MATAYRVQNSHDIFVQIDWTGTFSDHHLAYVCDAVNWWELTDVYPAGPGKLRVVDKGFVFERIPMRTSRQALTIRIFEKTELVAVFTHVYDEDDMLTMWEAHYAKLTAPEHIYVLDHGSPSSPKTLLKNATNVVSMPRGTLDNWNISQFCAYFQRFLLTQYKWVIHVDSDEFLISRDGPEQFRARLADAAPNQILVPKRAFDLVHDYRREAPLTAGRLITTQRSKLRPARYYNKPAVTSAPATWGFGFHSTFEDHLAVEDESLWMIHLAFVDFEHNMRRQIKWKSLPKAAATAAYFDERDRPGDPKGLERVFDRLLADDGIELPEWMLGMF